jgi:hypothetical protein
MAIKLGNTTASLYLGSTPVAAYLGAEQVYTAATVPGAPTNVSGQTEFGSTEVNFDPPEDDGGAAITSYKFYFDGIEQAPVTSGPSVFAFFNQDYTDQEVEVSAVNSAGEGPKSEPVTVVARPE